MTREKKSQSIKAGCDRPIYKHQSIPALMVFFEINKTLIFETLHCIEVHITKVNCECLNWCQKKQKLNSCCKHVQDSEDYTTGCLHI